MHLIGVSISAAAETGAVCEACNRVHEHRPGEGPVSAQERRASDA